MFERCLFVSFQRLVDCLAQAVVASALGAERPGHIVEHGAEDSGNLLHLFVRVPRPPRATSRCALSHSGEHARHHRRRQVDLVFLASSIVREPFVVKVSRRAAEVLDDLARARTLRFVVHIILRQQRRALPRLRLSHVAGVHGLIQVEQNLARGKGLPLC